MHTLPCPDTHSAEIPTAQQDTPACTPARALLCSLPVPDTGGSLHLTCISPMPTSASGLHVSSFPPPVKRSGISIISHIPLKYLVPPSQPDPFWGSAALQEGQGIGRLSVNVCLDATPQSCLLSVSVPFLTAFLKGLKHADPVPCCPLQLARAYSFHRTSSPGRVAGTATPHGAEHRPGVVGALCPPLQP